MGLLARYGMVGGCARRARVSALDMGLEAAAVSRFNGSQRQTSRDVRTQSAQRPFQTVQTIPGTADRSCDTTPLLLRNTALLSSPKLTYKRAASPTSYDSKISCQYRELHLQLTASSSPSVCEGKSRSNRVCRLRRGAERRAGVLCDL